MLMMFSSCLEDREIAAGRGNSAHAHSQGPGFDGGPEDGRADCGRVHAQVWPNRRAGVFYFY